MDGTVTKSKDSAMENSGFGRGYHHYLLNSIGLRNRFVQWITVEEFNGLNDWRRQAVES